MTRKDDFCCCGRTNIGNGTRIVGIVTAVIMGLGAVGCIWKFYKLGQAVELLDTIFGEDNSEAYQAAAERQRVYFGVGLGVCIVSFLTSVLLIFAVKKNNHLLALPYMIWFILGQIAAAILLILFAISLAFFNWEEIQKEGRFATVLEHLILPLISLLISFTIYCWFLSVVFAFYRASKAGYTFDSIPMQSV